MFIAVVLILLLSATVQVWPQNEEDSVTNAPSHSRVNVTGSRRLDGVMVTAAGVDDIIFPVSVKSAMKHLVDMSDLFVICPPTQCDALSKKHKKSFGPRVHFVKESSLPVQKQNVTDVMLKTAKKKRRPRYPMDGQSLLEKFLAGKDGWYLQQVLKFYAGEFLSLQDDWVVLDSDIVWHRDVHLRVHPHQHQRENATANATAAASAAAARAASAPALQDGLDPPQLPKYLYAYATQYHMQYYATMKVLLDIWPADKKRKHFSGIVHHMVFVKEVVETMKRYVEEKHGIPMWKAMSNVSSLELISHYPGVKNKLSGDGSVLSEYEMYFHWGRQKFPQTMKLRPLLFANGPGPRRVYWPRVEDNSIPADSWRRSPHWQILSFNQRREFISTQVRADALSGYDYNAYHAYATRRYFELMNSDVDNSMACKNLPMKHEPQEYYPNTTCSWKNFDENRDDEVLWFRDCLCYMFRYRVT